jgi:hypothetical protein
MKLTGTSFDFAKTDLIEEARTAPHPYLARPKFDYLPPKL